MRAPSILATMVLSIAAFGALAQSAGDRRDWPRTDFSRHAVPLSEIQPGGPPKDGIPVIVLRVGSEARAYPLQILVYHEIVNDTVAGRPVAVTFCPLCNAAIAFER